MNRIACLAVSAALLAVTRAHAQTSTVAVIELTGTVTWVDESIPSTTFEVGGFATLRITPDLETPPTFFSPNGLRYTTVLSRNDARLDGRSVISGQNNQPNNNFVIQDGDAGRPDTMLLTQSTRFFDGTQTDQGTAEFLLVDPQGDAWSSADLTTLPTSFELDPALGEHAELMLFSSLGTHVATASFSTFHIDATGEQGCTGLSNSTGLPGRLTGLGSRAIADNSFSIIGENLPADAFGYFIVSPNDAFIINPGANVGFLCMTTPIGRFLGPGEVQNTGASGTVTLQVDVSAVPTFLSGTAFEALAAGDTRYFQFWHRDTSFGQATSNFTSSLGVTFE